MDNKHAIKVADAIHDLARGSAKILIDDQFCLADIIYDAIQKHGADRMFIALQAICLKLTPIFNDNLQLDVAQMAAEYAASKFIELKSESPDDIVEASGYDQ